MKMMVLAAAAALTLGSATAFASDGGDLPATTAFTLFQHSQQPEAVVQASQQTAGVVGQTRAYPVQAQNQGTWLFAPDALGGGQQ